MFPKLGANPLPRSSVGYPHGLVGGALGADFGGVGFRFGMRLSLHGFRLSRFGNYERHRRPCGDAV
jgi:hypothetical protein